MPKERIAHPWLNLDHPYVFRAVMPKHTTDEELRGYLNVLFDLAQQRQHRFAWIVDMSHIMKATASQRRLFADSERRLAEHNARYSVGTALVIDTRWARGVLTAVFWMQKPTYPHAIVKSVDEAEAWVLARLAEAGIETSF
jgi:hypothetical protein